MHPDNHWPPHSSIAHADLVITIQRVRLRWDVDGRGAPAATARRSLDRAVLLPSVAEEADVAAHDVLVHPTRHQRLLTGDLATAGQVGLALTPLDDGALTVSRVPGSGTYPFVHRPKRLFTLKPGQVGRYRANFREAGRCCDRSWHFESWLVHVSNGSAASDRFLHEIPAHDIDDRVHLYG